MGNSASLNETINARISQLESLDINISKSFTKNSTNKCVACQAAFNFISFKKRKCVICMENYCSECVTHYKDSIYICYRCQIFISPDFGWSELMKLKSKDLVWYLNRKNISCHDCKEKEQLVEIILEKFRISDKNVYNDTHRSLNNLENLIRTDPEVLSSPETEYKNNGTNDNNNSSSQIPSSSSHLCPDSLVKRLPPPTYDEAMEGGYASSPNSRNERVPIEDITNITEIEHLSVKQLKDMLAYNKVDYKGCVERHELVSRVERLWTAYSNDRNFLLAETSDSITTTVTVKECVICMDRPVDCVLIECGHMLCCVRCGSKLAECPVCRQYVVRCIRVFPAQ